MSSATGTGNSLLRELVARRRRLRDALLAATGRADAHEFMSRLDAEESVRLVEGAAARPLGERFIKASLLQAADVDAVIRAQSKEPIPGLTSAESTELRKAQAEPGTSPEAAHALAGLATTDEIAHAYAEHLRLPIERHPPAPRIGAFLTARFGERGVTADVIERVVGELKELKRTDPTARLGHMLVQAGLIDDDELTLVVNEQGAAIERARGLVIDPALVNVLPEGFCREHWVVPLKLKGQSLRVAMANPTDILVVEEAQQLGGYTIDIAVASVTAVGEALSALFGVRDAVRELVASDYDVGSGPTENSEVVDLEADVPDAKDARIIRLANSILTAAILQGASDVHLEPFENDVKVRYRIDGHLLEVTPPTKGMFVPLVSRYKILARMDIAEKRIPQDGAICTRLGPQRVDLRVSVLPTVYGEKMVMRLLRRDGSAIKFDMLGFDEQQVKDFRKAINSPNGLLFVTGPTGSGKSTTLYAALHELNKPKVNIITVEDPVEQKIDGVNQVHVRTAVGLTFASALRSILRQDPDIVMVGEVRDRETAEIGLRAALTGHFVISTLHTNDALSAVPRLTDMGVERFLLAATLRLLEAQRLVRRLCSACAKSYTVDNATADRMGLPQGITLKRAVGCKLCRDRGYKGRVGIYEVIPFTSEIADRMVANVPVPEIIRYASAQGQKFLGDAAMAKAVLGVTSLEEAMSVTMGGHG